MRYYQYRRGNGNEGNYLYAIVAVEDNLSPYAMLKALVLNHYIPGTYTRRYINKNIIIDGDYTVYATVGATEFGAAWLTAELIPVNEPSPDEIRNSINAYDSLDRGAKNIFNKENKKG